MRKGVWKWLILGAALTVIVLYGMEASTSGIERIYGPIEGGTAAAAVQGTKPIESLQVEASQLQEQYAEDATAAERIKQLEKELKEVKKLAQREAIADGVEIEEGDSPAVNRLADGTADLLQTVTTGGIRFVVTLFDSVTN